MLVGTDETVPWHRQPRGRGLRYRVASGFAYADPHLFHELNRRDALEQTVDLGEMQVATKGPALSLWTADIGIQVAVQFSLGALRDLILQCLVAPLRQAKLGLHRDPDVLRLPDFQRASEQAT